MLTANSLIGTTLDSRYFILDKLAAGGFSQTYLAIDTRLPGTPTCVVKHLCPIHDSQGAAKSAQEMFQSEAEALQELGTHDRIPQLLAYFQEGQQLFLVQEWIDGHSLLMELPIGQPMAHVKAIALLEDVLVALEAVHSAQLIHRDIKPANLMRRHRDGVVMLIDFGTVQHYPSSRELPMAIGTVGYMAKEQEVGRATFSSDLYALGMVIIQALTGMPPNQLARTPTGELQWKHHLKERDRHLERVLDRMVSLDLNHRYASVLQVQQALRRRTSWRSPPRMILGGLGVLACMTLSISTAHQLALRSLGVEPGDRLSRLRYLLGQKEWAKAEAETQIILLKSIGQPTTEDPMFYLDQWTPKACATVRMLDTLWRNSSSQEYGWSVQRQIYQRLAPKSLPQFLELYYALEWQQTNPTSTKIPKGHYPHIFRGDAPRTIQKLLPRLFECLPSGAKPD